MCALLSIGAWAQPMTEQEAAERALEYLNQHSASSRAKAWGAAPSSKTLKAAKVGAEKIYAFNMEGGGYVIASGDRRTLPVLGYSDSGTIDWEQMPENMRAWLQSYDEAIATLGDCTDFADGNQLSANGEPLPARRTARVAIEPMVDVHWDQDAPYYNKMPTYDGNITEWQGKKCLTGCIATAMAQIMKYHEWPKTATAAIPAYDTPNDFDDESTMWHVDELPPVTFDWANMIKNYQEKNEETGANEEDGTEAQQDAVATLMRYCSQAVEMIITPEGSGTTPFETNKAFVAYFGYASTTILVRRSVYGIDEWEELIYNELAARRPVEYMGSHKNDGHAFVCDGYNEDGLFHINWGWGGYYDGYFSLSVLNPYYDKETGRAAAMGFTLDQSAVIGIQPPSEETEHPLPLGNVTIHELKQKSENVFTYTFRYYGAKPYPDITQDYALGTIEADGTLNPRFIGDPNDSIVYPGDNYMTVEIDPDNIQAGESLILYPMMKYRHHPELDWQLLTPKAYFIHAGRTEDGQYYMGLVSAKAEPPHLKIVDAKLNPESGKVGKTNTLTLTIHNEDEEDYTSSLDATLYYYGHIKAEDIENSRYHDYTYVEESGAYIRAGKDAEVTYTFKLNEDGVILLKLYTEKKELMDTYVLETNDPTAAISTLEVDEPDDAPYYDLQGRRLNGRPVQKGVYFHQGKKVLIP
jgi:hypothetical protein